ncbi:MAG: isoprenylcysteine carboxylmethyltransferase family protein [Clostridia bacterium]|nr:isoprenylcysteine carboxylmethyltransferase family protein [Clostridia bacterium]
MNICLNVHTTYERSFICSSDRKVVFSVYRIAALAIQALFYGFYLAKLLIQKRQRIRTNQMGTGRKPAKVLRIERIMCVATVLTLAVSVGSILLAGPAAHTGMRIAGFAAGVLAVLFFAAATITMKTSWRVGIPEEKTALVTNGVYHISRNPAFVGFDLLYLSACLLFPNLPLTLCALFAAVMLHLQILKEEEHLLRVFGPEYAGYMQQVRRYIGKK